MKLNGGSLIRPLVRDTSVPNEVVNRQLYGLGITIVAIFAAIIFRLQLFYLEQTSSLDFKQWDTMSCTPGDYTVQVKITNNMHEEYLKYKDSPNPEFNTLQDFFKDKLEGVVQNLPCVIDRHKDEKIEIAAISFGFKNKEVIQLLRKRGRYFGNLKFKEVNDVEQKLLALKSDPDQLKKICQPVTAFITFASSEGMERCAKYLCKHGAFSGEGNSLYKPLPLLGEEMRMNEAPEPSNIIWENLDVSQRTHRQKECCVGIVITIFIILTLVLFSVLKGVAGINNLKYPPRIDCKSINGQFNHADGQRDLETYKEFAEADSSNIKPKEGLYQSNGIY